MWGKILKELKYYQLKHNKMPNKVGPRKKKENII